MGTRHPRSRVYPAGVEQEHAEQRRFVTKVTGSEPRWQAFGRKAPRYWLGVCDDYPVAGARTAVTFGLARRTVSMWRGLPVGFELVLALHGDVADVIEPLVRAVSETDGQDRRRRPLIEANGVFAPGYAPHLLFTTAVSATPELMVRKKFADRYVEFMAAVPIDDRELRQYDRDVPGLISALRDQGQVLVYPRLTPPAVGTTA